MNRPTVFVVDDAPSVRDSLALMLQTAGYAVTCHDSAESFLAACDPEAAGCLVLDLRMPGMSGIELQEELARRGIDLPIIFLSAYGDVPTTVRAIRGGAQDFLTKPVDGKELIERVGVAIEEDRGRRARDAARRQIDRRMARLSPREREILALALGGATSLEIGAKLGISVRTVETHRAHILLKLGVRSLLEFASSGVAAGIPVGRLDVRPPERRP